MNLKQKDLIGKKIKWMYINDGGDLCFDFEDGDTLRICPYIIDEWNILFDIFMRDDKGVDYAYRNSREMSGPLEKGV